MPCIRCGGALLPLGMVWMVGSDYAAFNAGLFGYNAVLCAIALGDRSWAGAAWATLSVVISVLFAGLGDEFGNDYADGSVRRIRLDSVRNAACLVQGIGGFETH